MQNFQVGPFHTQSLRNWQVFLSFLFNWVYSTLTFLYKERVEHTLLPPSPPTRILSSHQSISGVHDSFCESHSLSAWTSLSTSLLTEGEVHTHDTRLHLNIALISDHIKLTHGLVYTPWCPIRTESNSLPHCARSYTLPSLQTRTTYAQQQSLKNTYRPPRAPKTVRSVHAACSLLKGSTRYPVINVRR